MSKSKDRYKDVEAAKLKQLIRAAERVIAHFEAKHRGIIEWKRHKGERPNDYDKENMRVLERYQAVKNEILTTTPQEISGGSMDLMAFHDDSILEPEPVVYSMGSEYTELDEWGD